jgi:hypothetical protein
MDAASSAGILTGSVRFSFHLMEGMKCFHLAEFYVTGSNAGLQTGLESAPSVLQSVVEDDGFGIDIVNGVCAICFDEPRCLRTPLFDVQMHVHMQTSLSSSSGLCHFYLDCILMADSHEIE